jgi:hypothetical protein
MNKALKRAQLFFSLSLKTREFKSLARANRLSKIRSKSVILVEHRYWAEQFVGLLPFIPAAMKIYDANPVVYEMFPSKYQISFNKLLKHRFSILYSIAKSKFLLVSASPMTHSRHLEVIKLLTSEKITKEDFVNFTYSGIQVGDLIYDFFLRKSKKITLEFNHPGLAWHISEFLQYVDFFEEYFKSNDVRAVLVSHPVYHFEIPVRMALKYKVDSYLVDMKRATRITAKFPKAYNNDWKELKKNFASLSIDSKERALAIGKNLLTKRLNGDTSQLVGLKKTTFYDQWEFPIPSIYHPNSVLIALHDFYDAVHKHGNFFYADFYEWLVSLSRIASKGNRQFFVKPHPWSLRNAETELRKIISESKNLTLLPPDFEHKNLRELGIAFATTVYGHIAEELPGLGINVINASSENRYKDFGFCITPKSREEYEHIIGNLDKLNTVIDYNSLYEFYFMNYSYNLPSWTVTNYYEFIKGVGGPREINSETLFSKYFAKMDKVNISCLQSAVTAFITSKDLILSRHHFNKNCAFEGSCHCRFLLNGDLTFGTV